MKELDKVYIHLTPHLGLLEATGLPVNAPNEQEYIRKDALIEWLMDEMDKSEKFSTCEHYSKVIEHLEEM